MEEKTFYDACILKAQVETNTPQGGDAGHGGKTRLTLLDAGGCAFAGDATEITVEVLGDAEAIVLADALTWAGEELRRQIEANPSPYPEAPNR